MNRRSLFGLLSAWTLSSLMACGSTSNEGGNALYVKVIATGDSTFGVTRTGEVRRYTAHGGPSTYAPEATVREAYASNGTPCLHFVDGRWDCGSPSMTTNRLSIEPAIAEMAVGKNFGCVRLVNGKVRCWGDAQETQALALGNSPGTDLPGLDGVLQLVAGDNHACTLRFDGTVQCWGGSASGSREVLRTVTGLPRPTRLEARGNRTCAIVTDGAVRCWTHEGSQSEVPQQVAGLSGVAQLALGPRHLCARLGVGTVRCWGFNGYGQTGGSSPTRDVSNLSNVIDISAGDRHTCAVTKDGGIHCWGDNAEGLVTAVRPPLRQGNVMTGFAFVDGLSDMVDIDMANSVACGIRSNGRVRCWGASESFGDLGPRAAHEDTALPDSAVQVAVGAGIACARLRAGGVSCWGGLMDDAIGNPVIQNVESLRGAIDINASWNTICAVMADSSVRCGDPRRADIDAKGHEFGTVPVPGLTGAKQVTVGRSHKCALLQDGSVRCWDCGDLCGGGSATVSIPGLRDIVQITAGQSVTCARAAEGSVRCWGDNLRLPGGTSTSQHIRELPRVTQMDASREGNPLCFRVSDGTLRCWGDLYAFRGIPSRSLANSTTYYPDIGDVEQVALGDRSACLRLTSGQVQCNGVDAPQSENLVLTPTKLSL